MRLLLQNVKGLTFWDTRYMLCSFVQHVPHQSLLRFHLNTLIHIIFSISYHNVIPLIISHHHPSNSVCTVAIHVAPPSSRPRAAVGYSPASFLALSLFLIDMSRRKNLHMLQIILRKCQSIYAARAQAAARGRRRSTGQTDGRKDERTDTRPLHRLLAAYCAGNVNRERKCADTTGTVLVPWAGHFQC